jgi:predicted Rossmann-fold nucleotide-binding protein
MMDVIASGTVNEHRKPILVLNYKGFYEPLKQQIAHMRALRFIPEQEHYKPLFVDTIDQLTATINGQNGQLND